MDVSRKDEIVVTLSVSEAKAIVADLSEAAVQALGKGEDVRGSPRWMQGELQLFRLRLAGAIGEKAT